MKVICTNHKDYTGDEYPGERPAIGEECEVVRSILGSGYAGISVPCYALAGYYRWVYDQRKFSPLDGPCEVAMLEERVEREIADLDKSFRDLVHETENA